MGLILVEVGARAARCCSSSGLSCRLQHPNTEVSVDSIKTPTHGIARTGSAGARRVQGSDVANSASSIIATTVTDDSLCAMLLLRWSWWYNGPYFCPASDSQGIYPGRRQAPQRPSIYIACTPLWGASWPEQQQRAARGVGGEAGWSRAPDHPRQARQGCLLFWEAARGPGSGFWQPRAEKGRGGFMCVCVGQQAMLDESSSVVSVPQ